MTEDMDAIRAKLMAAASKPRKGACQDCSVLDVVPGRRKCTWCAMNKLPPDEQIRLALERRSAAPEGSPRTVPASAWPPGLRWCGGCRHMVGRLYTRGARCRGCALSGSRESTWNLTPEQQQALLALSGGKCFVCGSAARTSTLAVDHDHRSGEIRGYLCGRGGASCNEVLGYWHDDPRRFLAMAVYLLAPPARLVLNPGTARTPRQVAEELIKMMKEVMDHAESNDRD